jgi:multidrug transporter EmrE-like cation transporter
MNTIPLILFGVLLNVIAQLLLKQGMNHIGYFAFSWQNLMPVTWQVSTNPYIVTGVFTYVFSVAIWLLVLSRVQVSYAYPLLSVGYIVNAFAAYYLFAEDLSVVRMLGIFIIMLGVYIVARS